MDMVFMLLNSEPRSSIGNKRMSEGYLIGKRGLGSAVHDLQTGP